jgi:hypothetical protein
MAIRGLDKDKFVGILHDRLSPSGPIQSVEHLFGREAQLREIDKALSSPGRHVFVYGDRGVGKTSLAQTAAFAHQSSDRDPLLVGCNRSTTFFEVVETIASILIGNATAGTHSETTTKKFAAFGFEFGGDEKVEFSSVPKATTFNAAVELLRTLSEEQSQKVLIVIDEFDLLPEKEKEPFADLIKQIGDRRIPIQFILCGIGQSLDDLLGAHPSCYRYLEGISVSRLRFDARLAIIVDSSEALGVDVPEPQRFRIAAISDGFPHFVHLICEKLYWELFYDEQVVRVATRDHYLAAIKAATRGIQQQLRRAYDMATMKDTDDNHFILWAAADHPNLVRRRNEIWESYEKIMKDIGEMPLPTDAFNRALSELKSPACGRILRNQSPKATIWYQFSENIVRGYVRLRAEEQGVSLATEYTDTTDSDLSVRSLKLKPVKGWRRALYSS